MESSEILALDVGTVRTGIARASAIAHLAEPLMSVETVKIFDCLEKLIKEHSAGAVVVGLPRNLNGDDTDQTRWVRAWADDAKKHLQLPLYWQDEALTTKQAEVHNDNKGHDIDSKAAAIILQDFLESSEEDRVLC